MKRCSKCGEEKPASPEFFHRKGKRLESWCKGCRTPAFRSQKLRRRYGLSEQDYQNLLDEQEGRCAICGSGDRFVVDHDHDTGEVRGLLCNACNRGLGMFSDSAERIEAAIEYLRKAA